jgi:hypothetical protein
MKKGLLEKYEENNVLRALVNLIPNIGGSLDILMSIKGSKWREERLKAFLLDLDSRIGEIENEGVLDKLSQSEEFYDLIVQSMNSVIKTRHQTKIECYANILVNSLILPKSEISTELLIAILDTITIDEIEYLSELKKSGSQIIVDTIEGEKVLWIKYREHLERTKSERIPQESLFKYNLDLIWKLLSDKNLIEIESKKDFLNRNYTYSTTNSSFSSSVLSTVRTSYKISPFGEKFIKWVLE